MDEKKMLKLQEQRGFDCLMIMMTVNRMETKGEKKIVLRIVQWTWF